MKNYIQRKFIKLKKEEKVLIKFFVQQKQNEKFNWLFYLNFKFASVSLSSVGTTFKVAGWYILKRGCQRVLFITDVTEFFKDLIKKKKFQWRHRPWTPPNYTTFSRLPLTVVSETSRCLARFSWYLRLKPFYRNYLKNVPFHKIFSRLMAKY